MQYAVATEQRAALYSRVNSELQPQIARDWHERADLLAATTFEHRKASAAAPKSKGRGGRKIGDAALKRRREEDWLTRMGAIAKYQLYLVRRDCAPDILLTPVNAASERCLWDELRDMHLGLGDTDLSRSLQSVNHAYFALIDSRLMQAEQAALEIAQKRELSQRQREKQLHVHRRTMAILYQEQELLTMTSAQSRAIGRDGAFIACGRRLKQCEFGRLFLWWSSDQLLDKYGVEILGGPDSESSDSSDDGHSVAVSEFGGVDEAILRDLFASDVEDDSDVDYS